MPATMPSGGLASGQEIERALRAWLEHDLAHALHGADREAVGATEAPRSLVLALLAKTSAGRDLYSACAGLGRLLAERGASPSLAVATLDGAACALGELRIALEATTLGAARASVVEGYFAAVLEAEGTAARRAWEYPACAVKVSEDTVGIVAGYPADDGEALADWSARVALCVSRDGYRRAILAGPSAAQTELREALALVGVALATTVAPKGWLSSLLKR